MHQAGTLLNPNFRQVHQTHRLCDQQSYKKDVKNLVMELLPANLFTKVKKRPVKATGKSAQFANILIKLDNREAQITKSLVQHAKKLDVERVNLYPLKK